MLYLCLLSKIIDKFMKNSWKCLQLNWRQNYKTKILYTYGTQKYLLASPYESFPQSTIPHQKHTYATQTYDILYKKNNIECHRILCTHTSIHFPLVPFAIAFSFYHFTLHPSPLTPHPSYIFYLFKLFKIFVLL